MPLRSHATVWRLGHGLLRIGLGLWRQGHGCGGWVLGCGGWVMGCGGWVMGVPLSGSRIELRERVAWLGRGLVHLPGTRGPSVRAWERVAWLGPWAWGGEVGVCFWRGWPESDSESGSSTSGGPSLRRWVAHATAL